MSLLVRAIFVFVTSPDKRSELGYVCMRRPGSTIEDAQVAGEEVGQKLRERLLKVLGDLRRMWSAKGEGLPHELKCFLTPQYVSPCLKRINSSR